MNLDHQREQARVRQARHRQNARADRIDQQATNESAKLPRVWQSEFLDFVRGARARADKALIQVEKSALLLSEGPARDTYLKRHYRNTKVSIPRLSKEFVKRKTSLARIELHQDLEYLDHTNDHRLTVEEIDWSDLEEVAWVLGEPSDAELAAPQSAALFLGTVALAGIGIGHTLTGFAQAIELFRFLETETLRQVVTDSA